MYIKGYMVIIKSWPSLRGMPPHPRKTVEEATLKQRRYCIEAAAPRITRVA